MKKSYILTFLSLLPLLISAQTDFITTWKTDNPGVSGNKQITISTYASETYNYGVDWGDGTSDSNVTGDIVHTYEQAGVYQVTISGEFPRIMFSNSNGSDSKKLLEINQWGNIQWKSFEYAFAGCTNLQLTATDTPDLSQVTNFSYAFYGCSNFRGNDSMNFWDMSNVIDFQGMFRNASSFDTDISDWDMSNAEDISEMFRYATSFNQDIGDWRFPKVTSLAWMFNFATNFNGNIGNWDVSNITAMIYTFEYAEAFNQDLSNWDLSNVTSTSYMFFNARSFNQDISGWNVSNVRSMSGMFNNAVTFDQSLGDWDIQSSISLSGMFRGTQLCTKNYDSTLAGWASLPNLQPNIVFDAGHSQYCNEAASRQSLIDNFDWEIKDSGASCPEPLSVVGVDLIDAVSDNILYTLRQNAQLNQDALSTDLLNFEIRTTGDVGSVHIELKDAQSSSVVSNEVPYTLFGNNGPDYAGEQLGLGNFTLIATPYSDDDLTGTPGVPYVLDFTILAGVSNAFITTWKTDAPGALNNNTIRIQTLSSEYYWYDVDWGDGVFSRGVGGSTNHTYEEPGTYTVKITGVFPGLNFANNLYAPKLISIDQWGDVDWENMNRAFSGCTNMDVLATDVPNLSNVDDMSYMFANCTSLKGNASMANWETENITDFSLMFWRAKEFNQDISSWNVSNVTDMIRMFYEASSFNQNLGSWHISNVTGMQDMFHQSGLTDANYEETLISWSSLPLLQDNVMLGAPHNNFCKAREARQNLVQSHGWIIQDAGLKLNCAIEGQMPFLTTWKTNNYGATNGNQITIYTDTRLEGNNYTVEWGDGTKDVNVQGEIVHTYAVPGTYRVAIYGDFLGMYFNNAGNMRIRDDDKILSIDQWGDIQWKAIYLAFAGCRYLDMKATDIPDLSHGPNLFGMFTDCPSFIGNESISDWDVSLSNSTAYMFKNAPLFNQPLDTWDTGNVTNMEYMFDGAKSFDQDVSTWNVSNVNHMMDIFNNSGFSDENYEKALMAWANLPSLKQNVRLGAPQNSFCEAAFERYELIDGYGWEITDMGRPSDCTNYHPKEYFITTWKTDNSGVSENNQVTIPTVSSSIYNYLVDWGDGTVDSQVRGNITHTYATPGVYDVSIAGNFPAIYFADVFDDPDTNDSDKLLNVKQWGAIQWSTMYSAFQGCRNMDVTATDTPDLSRVYSLNSMFDFCLELVYNESINDWDISNVGDLGNMFALAQKFDQPLGNWNTSKVINLTGMFFAASIFNQPLNNWDTGNVRTMAAVFAAAKLFNQPLNQWNTKNVNNMSGLFQGATSFNQPIGIWNVNNVTDMQNLFDSATNFNQDISNWNVSNVNNMNYMFFTAEAFDQDIGEWNVSKVLSMRNMFFGAQSFNQNIGNWNVQNVGSMEEMLLSSGISMENYDNILKGWASLPSLKNNVLLEVDSEYCDGELARNQIIDEYGWTILDLGKTSFCNQDNDNDGVLDQYDDCLNTREGAAVNANGCEFIANNAILVNVFTPSCIGKEDGEVQVLMEEEGYQLEIAMSGEQLNNSFSNVSSGEAYRIKNLPAGKYTVTVSIPRVKYEQVFGVEVKELESVTAKQTHMDTNRGTVSYTVHGSYVYQVSVNGRERKFNFNTTGPNTLQLGDLSGFTEVRISGANDCQGIVQDQFYMNNGVTLYPTITSGEVTILSETQGLGIEIFNISGQLVQSIERLDFVGGKSMLQVDALKSGIYLVKLHGEGKEETIKIIKR